MVLVDERSRGKSDLWSESGDGLGESSQISYAVHVASPATYLPPLRSLCSWTSKLKLGFRRPLTPERPALIIDELSVCTTRLMSFDMALGIRSAVHASVMRGEVIRITLPARQTT